MQQDLEGGKQHQRRAGHHLQGLRQGERRARGSLWPECALQAAGGTPCRYAWAEVPLRVQGEVIVICWKGPGSERRICALRVGGWPILWIMLSKWAGIRIFRAAGLAACASGEQNDV